MPGRKISPDPYWVHPKDRHHYRTCFLQQDALARMFLEKKDKYNWKRQPGTHCWYLKAEILAEDFTHVYSYFEIGAEVDVILDFIPYRNIVLTISRPACPYEFLTFNGFNITFTCEEEDRLHKRPRADVPAKEEEEEVKEKENSDDAEKAPKRICIE